MYLVAMWEQMIRKTEYPWRGSFSQPKLQIAADLSELKKIYFTPSFFN